MPHNFLIFQEKMFLYNGWSAKDHQSYYHLQYISAFEKEHFMLVYKKKEDIFLLYSTYYIWKIIKKPLLFYVLNSEKRISFLFIIGRNRSKIKSSLSVL